MTSIGLEASAKRFDICHTVMITATGASSSPSPWSSTGYIQLTVGCAIMSRVGYVHSSAGISSAPYAGSSAQVLTPAFELQHVHSLRKPLFP